MGFSGLLGGSWVVISWVMRPLISVIIMVTLLITPLITTQEPPSRASENPQKVKNAQGRAPFPWLPRLVWRPSQSNVGFEVLGVQEFRV